jgi:hypothetical protein
MKKTIQYGDKIDEVIRIKLDTVSDGVRVEVVDDKGKRIDGGTLCTINQYGIRLHPCFSSTAGINTECGYVTVSRS